MKILLLSSEVAPYSKTGGLGDVAGALPGALADLGHEVMVVTPLYGSIKRDGLEMLDASVKLRFPFGEPWAQLWSVEPRPGVEFVFLDHPGFFHRNGIYGDRNGDFGDNHRRFAFLSIGGLSTAQVLGFDPDIVHLNDWQTGPAAIALMRGYRGTSLERARSVFTIHNLAYQGLFSKNVVNDLGLPWDLFVNDGIEYHDAVSFMKAGLCFADAITTVSRRYAQEIQTAELGCTLEGVLRARRRSLHGIVNGVDYTEWDPTTDPFLPAHFSADDLSGKEICKRELLKTFGFPDSPEAQRRPLFGIVTRLADQKGIDLLCSAMHTALETNLSFVALGSGDPRLEQALRELEWRFPDRARVRIGFDAKLSHLVEAGCDFFFMPSRYEPCGLNQMYSLRYGTLPIVRATGGLDDTVDDLSSPIGTGIKFQRFDRGELLHAIWRALTVYPHPEAMRELRQRGMSRDYSWAVSAKQYEQLYKSLLPRTG